MAESHRVALGDGTSLYVEELGRAHGTAVVFGHSLLCDGRMFTDQVIDLARDHHVINIDFRGHGRSDPPSRAYSMADQAGDTLRVMDALGIERAILVGLSMGGMAAMRLALEHPDRVAGLALLNTSAGREEALKRARYGALAAVTRLFGTQPWIMRQASRALFGATFLRDQPDVVALWEQRIAAMDRRALALAVKMVTGRPDLTGRLGELRVPTLVVVGDEDVATPLVYARTLAAAIPGARLEVVPMTGHLSTVERPELMTKLLRAFCERVAGA